jgi:hypothetical protein
MATPPAPFAQDKLSRGQHIPCRAANQVPNRIGTEYFKSVNRHKGHHFPFFVRGGLPFDLILEIQFKFKSCRSIKEPPTAKSILSKEFLEQNPAMPVREISWPPFLH